MITHERFNKLNVGDVLVFKKRKKKPGRNRVIIKTTKSGTSYDRNRTVIRLLKLDRKSSTSLFYADISNKVIGVFKLIKIK